MDFVPGFSRSRLWKSKADFFRPFRTAAAEAGENILPLFDPDLHRAEPEEADLKDLNTALRVLVEVFPDVEPEVFREMLMSVSEESRVQVVTEQLLNKKAKRVRGRNRAALVPNDRKDEKSSTRPSRNDATGLTDEDSFRSDSYKKAVKQVFYLEFRNLSHSSIKAVLAEQNFSYRLARPSLQRLSERSWRFSLSSFFTKRSPSSIAGDHPYIVWQPSTSNDGQSIPSVKRTGSSRLDRELYDLFVVPILENQRQALLAADHALAVRLNHNYAEKDKVLVDCDCCLDPFPFEQVSTCDDGCHILCFNCVRRTVNEALFGQGWSRTVDLERSTVRCFALGADSCDGIIPINNLRHALTQGLDNEDTWNDFQERIASEILTKSRLPLQRCPFCNYVEVDELPNPQWRKATAIWTHIVRRTSIAFQIAFIALLAAMLIFTIPLVLLASIGYLALQIFPSASTTLNHSWSRVYKHRRGLKFKCRNPPCTKTSCTRCLATWRDPHTCFENEKTSLRTAIESSATAAIKRTCPKCLLSFVKASGCNKLVCNCGYTMCYICRQEITSKEGYAHFCQHFRPSGGRCVECERCDLYGDEDEEAAIRGAAEEAERAWKEREGLKAGGDERVTRAMVKAVVEGGRERKGWEVWLDAVVDAVVA